MNLKFKNSQINLRKFDTHRCVAVLIPKIESVMGKRTREGREGHGWKFSWASDESGTRSDEGVQVANDRRRDENHPTTHSLLLSGMSVPLRSVVLPATEWTSKRLCWMLEMNPFCVVISVPYICACSHSVRPTAIETIVLPRQVSVEKPSSFLDFKYE